MREGRAQDIFKWNFCLDLFAVQAAKPLSQSVFIGVTGFKTALQVNYIKNEIKVLFKNGRWPGLSRQQQNGRGFRTGRELRAGLRAGRAQYQAQAERTNLEKTARVTLHPEKPPVRFG